MKSKILLALIIVSSIFGCKGEKSVDDLEVITEQVADKTFKVTLEVIVSKDDDFSLFYTDGSSTSFKEPLWTGVKASLDTQKVTYSIPNEIFPLELRLDFGVKKDKQDVVLKSVSFDYNGKNRTINGAELGKYFRADESKCSFDPVTGVIKPIDLKGEKLNSSLYPQEKVLMAEIEKLLK